MKEDVILEETNISISDIKVLTPKSQKKKIFGKGV